MVLAMDREIATLEIVASGVKLRLDPWNGTVPQQWAGRQRFALSWDTQELNAGERYPSFASISSCRDCSRSRPSTLPTGTVRGRSSASTICRELDLNRLEPGQEIKRDAQRRVQRPHLLDPHRSCPDVFAAGAARRHWC